MMKTVAIVAARGGSVRLRRKALRPFAGSSLVAHKVTQLRVCPEIDAVYVNTDDGDVAAAAAEAGALLLEGRDYQMDAREMIRHSCRQVEAETLVVWAHPTNPLVRPSTYESALTAYRMGLSVGFDSLLSVTPQRRHAWWHGRPLNYEPSAQRHPVAAELEPVNFQDGAIFIQTRERFLETAYFFGARPRLFDIPWDEGWDIDTEADYRVALALAGGG